MLNVAEVRQLFDDLERAASKIIAPHKFNIWFDGRRPTDRSLDGHRACIAIPAAERGGLTASWGYSHLMLRLWATAPPTHRMIGRSSLE